MSGQLYLVPTPIGNLKDITLRAIDILKEVDIIASEDTRHTGQLLAHLQISKQQIGYHNFSERKVAPELIERLKEGKNIALVTDAGTPGIADPAFYIVRMAIQENINVISLPGPCAAVTALVASGLPSDRFVFENFVPRKQGKRRTFLESLKNEPRTIILYESPFRVLQLLQDMLDVYGNIPIVIARELSKKFEEVLRKPASDLIAHFTVHPPKGEFVILFNLNLNYKIEADEKQEEPLC
jgi:16S rRNA (cytidine1402-2'-O)-methyltransferase